MKSRVEKSEKKDWKKDNFDLEKAIKEKAKKYNLKESFLRVILS